MPQKNFPPPLETRQSHPLQKALVLHPQGPPVLRLGIGMCHFMLNNVDKARQAFQRVLQLDPENVEALVALAMSDLNSGDGQRLLLCSLDGGRPLVSWD